MHERNDGSDVLSGRSGYLHDVHTMHMLVHVLYRIIPNLAREPLTRKKSRQSMWSVPLLHDICISYLSLTGHVLNSM